ncbi:unnamed protein product [Ilex paraguariensis]|uniref:Uncharacterized protein n=1 Tax=Ilex paraguariensis TaxID=185542 RepID=A0ABC8RZM2_9AQUA
MEWVRGGTIGHGSFGIVNLAIPRSQSPQIPPLMAVKSCDASHSILLMNKRWFMRVEFGLVQDVGNKFDADPE